MDQLWFRKFVPVRDLGPLEYDAIPFPALQLRRCGISGQTGDSFVISSHFFFFGPAARAVFYRCNTNPAQKCASECRRGSKSGKMGNRFDRCRSSLQQAPGKIDPGQFDVVDGAHCHFGAEKTREMAGAYARHFGERVEGQFSTRVFQDVPYQLFDWTRARARRHGPRAQFDAVRRLGGWIGAALTKGALHNGPAPVLFRSGAHVRRPSVRMPRVISSRGLSVSGANCRSR
jgi:hypothetical protein